MATATIQPRLTDRSGAVVPVPAELVEIVGAERMRRALAAWLDDARSLRGTGGTCGPEVDIAADGQAQGDPRVNRRRRIR